MGSVFPRTSAHPIDASAAGLNQMMIRPWLVQVFHQGVPGLDRSRHVQGRDIRHPLFGVDGQSKAVEHTSGSIRGALPYISGEGKLV